MIKATLELSALALALGALFIWLAALNAPMPV
jgi:hypothetical protein